MNTPQTIVYWIGLFVVAVWICSILFVLLGLLLGWILDWPMWRRDLWR